MEPVVVWSFHSGGNRARAMVTRQSDCEAEIVPSLHSKRGDASATGVGFDAIAGSSGAEFWATGFPDKAQPVHESRISKAEVVRIASHPGGYASSRHG